MIEETDIVPQMAHRLREAGDGSDTAGLLDALGVVPSEEVVSLVERARRHLDRDRRSRAERRAFLAAVVSPGRDDVQSCVKAVFAPDHDDDLVRMMWETVRAPSDPEAGHTLANALRRQDRPGAAAAAFRRLLMMDPKDGEAWRSLAAVMRDAKDYEAALILARHLIGLQPDDAWAHIQHGNILGRLSRPEDAIRAYDLALELDPDAGIVHAAIGRQARRLGQLDKAAGAFRDALHEDPDDWRSADGLAEIHEVRGDHGEALMWRRRVRQLRPKSNTALTNLATALLRREHWPEGSERMARLEGTEDPGADPLWDGTPASGTIAVYHRRSDPAVQTLMGLAAVRRLAEAGHIILCSLPSRLADLMLDSPPSLGFVEDDATGARNGAFGNTAAAYLALADAPRFAERHAAAHGPWLKPPTDKPRAKIERIAFVTAKEPVLEDLDMAQVRAHMADQFDIRALYGPARPAIDKTVRAMRGVDVVVTDDSLTALVAAGTGVPSIVLLPHDADWWWGDRGGASPWSARQTLVRLAPGYAMESVNAAVQSAVERSGVPEAYVPPPTPDSSSTELVETVERLAGHFGKQANPTIAVQKLTGGTRNKVYRLRAAEGDKVLRLGRYPPPRKHFYAKEANNMRLAADAGLAPRVDFTDALDGSMLIEHIDGETMRSKGIRMAENAVAIGRLYRRLHQLPGFHDRFDIFEKIERNVQRLQRGKSEPFAEQQKFNELMARIGAILTANGVPHYATHNDPLTRNFIRADEKMMIIDWECSGLGDPHWEVAALSAQAGLEEDVWHAYMVSYFGAEEHPGICRIPLFEAACRYFWWTDALCTGLKRPDGNSWKDKAGRWWGWFTEVVETPRFDKAMRAAEDYRWELSHSPASRRFGGMD